MKANLVPITAIANWVSGLWPRAFRRNTSKAFPGYCCDVFGAMIAEHAAGKRGNSIYLVRMGGSVACFYEFSALDRGIDPQVLKGCGDVFLSISGRHGINFCPWCGADISKFYRMAELPECSADDYGFPP